jgi:archaeal flagellin N-terminal-like domain
MRLGVLFADKEAVSPVIGVILMVAVTVILAAVVAAFTLGFSENQSVTPQVTFDYTYDSDTGSNAGELTVRHYTGDTFESDRVRLRGTGLNSSDLGKTWTELDTSIKNATDVRTGSRIIVGVIDSEFEAELIWESDDGKESSVISQTSGPLPTDPTG